VLREGEPGHESLDQKGDGFMAESEVLGGTVESRLLHSSGSEGKAEDCSLEAGLEL
jgi:hypothetical protein